MHLRHSEDFTYELETYETITLLYQIEEGAGFLAIAETGITSLLDSFVNASIDVLIERNVLNPKIAEDYVCHHTYWKKVKRASRRKIDAFYKEMQKDVKTVIPGSEEDKSFAFMTL